LILLNDGLSLDEVATIVQVQVRTVDSTRTAWFFDNIDPLGYLARSEAPKKLPPIDFKRLNVMTGAGPLTAKALRTRYTENSGTLVYVSRVTLALKSAELFWKRTRHSLKQKRNAEAFRASQLGIDVLRAQAAAG
jgi:transposase